MSEKEQEYEMSVGTIYNTETIGKLALALSKAQANMTGAQKNKTNPFLKNSYADLASCWDAIRGPLSENGLAVIQTLEYDNNGICIVTILAHESGESIESRLVMKPVKDDPQGVGSVITYGRRYGLCAIVGLAPVDDDGGVATMPDKVKTISSSKVAILDKLLKDTESDIKAFLTFAKAESLDSILDCDFKRLESALKSKLTDKS